MATTTLLQRHAGEGETIAEAIRDCLDYCTCSGWCQCRDCWRTVPFAVRDGLPAVLPDCPCVFQIAKLRVVP